MLNNFRAFGSYSKVVVSFSFLLTLLVSSAFAQDSGPNTASANGESRNAGDAQVSTGEQLFKGNCASCHRASDEVLTGPGLRGVTTRWKGREALLKQWVKNPSSVIATGDPYVKELVAKYASAGIMPAQGVSDTDIEAIFKYVDSAPDPQPLPPTTGEGGGTTGGDGNSDDDNTVWYLVIASMLLVVIFSVAGVRRSLYNTVAEKKGLPTTDGLTYWQTTRMWINRNRLLTAFIIIFLLVLGLKETWDALAGIGVYQGYKPEQPIKFSHKVHAGQNKINCVYCHSSAEKSRHAGIPSTNVCMNCHTAVTKGKVTGTTEIAKIYEAAGWDPQQRAYTGAEKPVKWIKIHNLPDHSYFNHSQHVVVGKIECQECHGKVEEMDVVEQHAPLTMGWCVNCHGEKEVQMAGNGYYDEIHARLTKAELKKYLNDDGKVSVRELGGWECTKCHY